MPPGGRVVRSYLLALRRYADFRSRASRNEFWLFQLVNWSVLVVIYLLDEAWIISTPETGHGLVLMGYIVLTLLPSLAVLVRRVRDTGRSPWFLLIALVPVFGLVKILLVTLSQGQSLRTADGDATTSIR